jgi:hypothetical protein
MAWGRVVAAVVLSAAFIGAVPGAVSAQARRGSAPGPGDAPGVSVGELQRLFDAYVLMQAQETLQLSEEQYPGFLARLKTLQETRRRTQGERLRIVQELRRLVQSVRTAPGAAEASGAGADARTKEQITERIKALREADARAADAVLQAMDRLDEVLDPVQQAKLRIFEEQMERRKLELLMRARQGNRARSLR